MLNAHLQATFDRSTGKYLIFAPNSLTPGYLFFSYERE